MFVTMLNRMVRLVGRIVRLLLRRGLPEQSRIDGLPTGDDTEDPGTPHRLSEIARQADWPQPTPRQGGADRPRPDAEG